MAEDMEIIWDTHENFILRDLQRKRQNEIFDIMSTKYFDQNRLFNQMKYRDDPVNREVFIAYVKHILDGEASIIAEDMITHDIMAVALINAMTEDWLSWSALTLTVDPSRFTEIIDLKYRMINQFAVDNPDHPFDSLHLFEYYIDESLRENADFMTKFFNVIANVAMHMKLTRVTFISLSEEEQTTAMTFGYRSLLSTIYSIYTNRGVRPFAALRDIDEMQADLFEMSVVPVKPYTEMKVRGIETNEPDITQQQQHIIPEQSSNILE